MSAKHTPGPWAVLVGHDGSISVAADGPRRINLTTAGTPVIADVCRHADAEHFSGEANARLIAAAPELLKALKLVMRCAGDIASAPDGLLEMALDDGDEETRRQANAFLVARAAIAKAEGQQ